jgi:hypothetical protein
LEITRGILETNRPIKKGQGTLDVQLCTHPLFHIYRHKTGMPKEEYLVERIHGFWASKELLIINDGPH